MSEQPNTQRKPNSISSSVEVAADPATTFKVFTEEVNCWWLQGPINFHDSTRAYEMRIEPGLGGRVLEVYDLDTGEGHELATITHWEPGARLAWKSLIDDVDTEVTFEAIASGTLVTVVATIKGEDRGGSAWVGMTPTWLARWFERREHEAHTPLQMAKLALVVHYADPIAAAHWLQDVFGFSAASPIPEAFTDHTWIEFHVGNVSLILFAGTAGHEGVTHTPWVFVDDLDAQYGHVTVRGAEIVEEPTHHGARWFTAKDLGGHQWTFAQASPRM